MSVSESEPSIDGADFRPLHDRGSNTKPAEEFKSSIVDGLVYGKPIGELNLEEISSLPRADLITICFSSIERMRLLDKRFMVLAKQFADSEILHARNRVDAFIRGVQGIKS